MASGLGVITTSQVISSMYKPDNLASLLTILQWLLITLKIKSNPSSIVVFEDLQGLAPADLSKPISITVPLFTLLQLS